MPPPAPQIDGITTKCLIYQCTGKTGGESMSSTINIHNLFHILHPFGSILRRGSLCQNNICTSTKVWQNNICTVFTKTHWSEDRGQWIWGLASENWKSRSPTGFWFSSNFVWYTLGVCKKSLGASKFRRPVNSTKLMAMKHCTN